MTPQLRSFHHSAFPFERVRAERNGTISVCVPARECAETILWLLGPAAGYLTGQQIAADGGLTMY